MLRSGGAFEGQSLGGGHQVTRRLSLGGLWDLSKFLRELVVVKEQACLLNLFSTLSCHLFLACYYLPCDPQQRPNTSDLTKLMVLEGPSPTSVVPHAVHLW